MHVRAPEPTSRVPTTLLGVIPLAVDSPNLRERLLAALTEEFDLNDIEFMIEEAESVVLVRSADPPSCVAAYEAGVFIRGFLAGFVIELTTAPRLAMPTAAEHNAWVEGLQAETHWEPLRDFLEGLKIAE